MLACRYEGPFDAIEVAGRTLERGETVDISPDDLARELCESGVLVLAETTTTKKGDSK